VERYLQSISSSRYYHNSNNQKPAKTSAPKAPAPTPAKASPAPTAAVKTSPAAQVTSTPVTGLNADEQLTLELINKERTKAGLEPLKIDAELQKVARLKAKDMVEKNYFSHQSRHMVRL